jgi:hypothetical protein
MTILLLEDFKSYTGMTNPKSDERLGFIIDFVNKFIVKFCNTSFTPVTITNKRLSCTDSSSIILPNAPIISVDKLTISGYEVTDFELLHEEGIIESITPFTLGRYNVLVDYTYGYTEVPEDILQAAIELTKYYLSGKFSTSISVKGETVDQNITELIPAHIRVILTQYKVL